MGNKNDIAPAQYHYDADEIGNQVMENLGRRKEYRKLLEQYDTACRQRHLVKMTQLSVKINQMKAAEIQRLVDLEDNRRKDVHNIVAMLQQIDLKEYEKYQDLMSGLCFLLDMLDYTIADINDLLHRTHIGVEMGQFHEVDAVKKMAAMLSGSEVKSMPEYQREVWLDEADRLYDHLRDRTAVYRRKVERIEARIDKQKETTQ